MHCHLVGFQVSQRISEDDCYLVGSRFHDKQFGEMLSSGRVQALQISEVDEVNCYLVGSRFHNKLLWDLVVIWSDSRFHNKFMRGIVIWSDPGFTITCWGRGKLYWGIEFKSFSYPFLY